MSYFYYNKLKGEEHFKFLKFIEAYLNKGSTPKGFFDIVIW